MKSKGESLSLLLEVNDMQRFYLNQKIGNGDLIEMPKDIAHQIYSVMRMRVGDKIILFNGSGFDFVAEIKKMDKSGCTALVSAKNKNNIEPKSRIILFQSIIKKDKLEWVFEKCTEIGISGLVPVLSARSVKKDFNRVRAEKIIREASEQSGRAVLPDLHDVMSFDEAVEFAVKNCKKIFFAHIISPKGPSFGSEVVDNSLPEEAPLGVLGLFVGPEGGWTDEEAE